jgi:hypothetical protein
MKRYLIKHERVQIKFLKTPRLPPVRSHILKQDLADQALAFYWFFFSMQEELGKPL